MELRTMELRDGTTVSIIPMDLDRFIQFKDLLANVTERVFMESPNGNGNAQSPNGTPAVQVNVDAKVILMRALKKLNASDVLDLLQCVTGYEDREHLRKAFRPANLFTAIQYTLLDEGIDLGGLLGEAQRSSGQTKNPAEVLQSS